MAKNTREVILPISELRRSLFSISPNSSSPRTPPPCMFSSFLKYYGGEGADIRLCGGLTVYAPMIRNGAGPGKKIGVVGLGGL
jgi:hypothetical protein